MDANNRESAADVTQRESSGATGTAARMKRNISEKAAEAKEIISDFGRKAADQLEDTRHSTAGVLEKTASSLHSSSDQLSDFGHSTANKIQATAEYVRDTDLKGIAADIQYIVKQYPMQSLAAAAIIGFLVARGVRRNS
jgi:ElaB/YqjD/DUF883 family membrane-anchored ribosome-binding protein